MSADRRVPTAADVERWGDDWWCSWSGGPACIMKLEVYNGRVQIDLSGGAGEDIREIDYFGDDYRWLGPVNPEPLPWPEGER